VGEDGEVVEQPEHDEAASQRRTTYREIAGLGGSHESDHTDECHDGLECDHGLEECVLQPVVIEPLHHAIGVLPFDRKGLGERAGPPSAFGDRIESLRHHLVHVPITLLEEVPLVQGADEIGDGIGIQVTRRLELFEHDLLHGPGAVHLPEQRDITRIQPVVQEVARVRDHHVVVAPLERELTDLHVVGELRPVPVRIQELGELIPDPVLRSAFAPRALRDEVVHAEARHGLDASAARSRSRRCRTVS
jgi:hypothetical protein